MKRFYDGNNSDSICNMRYTGIINDQQKKPRKYIPKSIIKRLSNNELEEVRKNFMYYDTYFRPILEHKQSIENVLYRYHMDKEKQNSDGLNQSEIDNLLIKLLAYKKFLSDRNYHIDKSAATTISNGFIKRNIYYEKLDEKELLKKGFEFGNPNGTSTYHEIDKRDLNIAIPQLEHEHIYICQDTVYERCKSNFLKSEERIREEFGDNAKHM